MTVLLATADGPITPGSTVPNFMFPEPAAAVLGRSWAYGRWLATEAAAPPAVVADVDASGAGELIAGAPLDGSRPSRSGDDRRPARGRTASRPADAIRRRRPRHATRATEVGFPVAVKARHRHVGRSVRAGVALDLADAAAVAAAIDVMRAAARRRRRLRHRPGDGTARDSTCASRRRVDDEAGAVDLGRHRRASRPDSSAIDEAVASGATVARRARRASSPSRGPGPP